MRWQTKPAATLKIQDTDTNGMFTVAGIKSSADNDYTGEQMQGYVNLLLGIGGESAVLNHNAKFDVTRYFEE